MTDRQCVVRLMMAHSRKRSLLHREAGGVGVAEEGQSHCRTWTERCYPTGEEHLWSSDCEVNRLDH